MYKKICNILNEKTGKIFKNETIVLAQKLAADNVMELFTKEQIREIIQQTLDAELCYIAYKNENIPDDLIDEFAKAEYSKSLQMTMLGRDNIKDETIEYLLKDIGNEQITTKIKDFDFIKDSFNFNTSGKDCPFSQKVIEYIIKNKDVKDYDYFPVRYISSTDIATQLLLNNKHNPNIIENIAHNDILPEGIRNDAFKIAYNPQKSCKFATDYMISELYTLATSTVFNEDEIEKADAKTRSIISESKYILNNLVYSKRLSLSHKIDLINHIKKAVTNENINLMNSMVQTSEDKELAQIAFEAFYKGKHASTKMSFVEKIDLPTVMYDREIEWLLAKHKDLSYTEHSYLNLLLDKRNRDIGYKDILYNCDIGTALIITASPFSTETEKSTVCAKHPILKSIHTICTKMYDNKDIKKYHKFVKSIILKSANNYSKQHSDDEKSVWFASPFDTIPESSYVYVDKTIPIDILKSIKEIVQKEIIKTDKNNKQVLNEVLRNINNIENSSRIINAANQICQTEVFQDYLYLAKDNATYKKRYPIMYGNMKNIKPIDTNYAKHIIEKYSITTDELMQIKNDLIQTLAESAKHINSPALITDFYEQIQKSNGVINFLDEVIVEKLQEKIRQEFIAEHEKD